MDVADPVCDQVYDLFGSIDDACLLHGGRVVAVVVHNIAEALGHIRSGHGGGAGQLGGFRDRHDAGDNRYPYPFLPDAVQEVIEDRIVVEQLGREEIQSRIRFFLQVPYVIFLVSAFDVPFRIAGASDTEIPKLLYIPDEIDGVPVILRQTSACGNISAQGQDILDLKGTVAFHHFTDKAARGRDAGQVGKHRDAVFILDLGGNSRRIRARTAAGAVSHAHEIRLQRRYCFGRLGDALIFIRCFRGKDFEGQRYLVEVQYGRDLHKRYSFTDLYLTRGSRDFFREGNARHSGSSGHSESFVSGDQSCCALFPPAKSEQ